jgi:endoglucanase
MLAPARQGGPPLSRRRLLAGAGLLLACRPARAGETRADWEAFKARFLKADGRVVDTGNAGVSHTEGQGWGLLFAEHFDDPAVFARIWEWTGANLKRPADALHSWRYDPSLPSPVADLNNATDGDLFIGMALSRAAWRWRNPAYADASAAIGRDILRLLVRTVGDRTVLLPGCEGFEGAAEVVLNPSYYVFPALTELSARAPSPVWSALAGDGQTLLSQARFGRWQLVPDWLQLDRASGATAPAPKWPARFSFDAIRVPLYLAWGRLPGDEAFRQFAAQFGDGLPAWADLASDQIAPFPAPPGMRAVALLASAGPGTVLPDPFPAVADAPDYYSAALTLLTRVAYDDAGRAACPTALP